MLLLDDATAGSGSRGTGGGVVAITYPIQPKMARIASTATKAEISRTAIETYNPPVKVVGRYQNEANTNNPYTITPMIAPTTRAAPMTLSRAMSILLPVDRKRPSFHYLCFGRLILRESLRTEIENTRFGRQHGIKEEEL